MKSIRRQPKRSNSKCSAVQLVVSTLIVLSIALLFTAFQLMHRLARDNAARDSSLSTLQNPHTVLSGKAVRATSKKAVATQEVVTTREVFYDASSAKITTDQQSIAAAVNPKTTNKVLTSPYDPWPDHPYDPKSTPGVLRSNGIYASNRIYCMIPFVWRKDFYDTIMSTWGRRCDQIYFFTDSIVNLESGFHKDFITGVDTNNNNNNNQTIYRHYTDYPAGTFPSNVIFINMTRSWDGCLDLKTSKPKICRHIWEKMWRSWVYVSDNHLQRAEWFCKIDYDTYFFPENLQYYIQDYKRWDDATTGQHYFGHLLYHRNIIAGPCACWSQKTLSDISQVYKRMPKGYPGDERNKCEDRAGATEEVSTSKCLKYELNILPDEAIDDHHRDYIMLDPYENHLKWNRTEQGEWWFWKNKEKERGQMEECCAHRPIAIHKYKYTRDIVRLEQEFYGKEDNDYRKKMKEVNRKYVDKVRMAMNIGMEGNLTI
eukprot:scaffold23394_cov42-Cyclotella_meneghiniana.AAC.9